VPAASPTTAPSRAPGKPPDREQVAATAARFFDALLGRRAAALAALCAPSFSFDGHAAGGADKVKGRWSEIVARQQGAAYALQGMEVLSAAEATARYGKPPKRIASLVSPGSFVAVASLSGRPTLVFFSRQSGAWLATGIHD
jgi:hypothetical protein